MKIYATDHFVLPLPVGHRFPMSKYSALRARVAAVAGATLHEPAAATVAELTRVHDAGYVAAVLHGTLEAAAVRRIGFPWSPAMVERSRRSTGATIAACRSALEHGCGINLAGGTHHAHAASGQGFCVFNDAAVAARTLQAEGAVGRVLIVDLDVHQGDGTAAIFAHDASVFTMSVHGRNNFPFRKSRSDLDIELDDGTGDAAYLATLAAALPRTLERAQPDLAIYLAGADTFAGDRLGKLALTKAGLRRRDEFVLGSMRDHRIPVAIAMAGGYADNIDDIVDIHLATVVTAISIFAASEGAPRATKPHIGPRHRLRTLAAGVKPAC